MFWIRTHRCNLMTLQDWTRPRSCCKRQCCYQFLCPSTSEASDDPGRESACLGHQGLERPCWRKRLLRKAKRRSSMFLPRLLPPSGRVNQRNSCEFCSRWPDSTDQVQSSLTRSMLWPVSEVEATSTKRADVSKQSYSFKWMEFQAPIVLVQMMHRTVKQPQRM